MTMLAKIFTDFQPGVIGAFLAGYPVVVSLIVAGFVIHFLPSRWNEAAGRLVARMPLVAQLLLFVLMVYLVVQVRGSEVQPFIYLSF